MSDLLYLHFDVRDELLDAARQCEEDVFLQAFGNTREQLEDEYGPYNDQSLFMAVADADGYVVGACRLIAPGPAGNKTLNDIRREPWHADAARATQVSEIDLGATWDIATIGVRRDYRGAKLMVAMSLYHGIMKATRVNEVKTATAILDVHAHRVLADAGYLFTTLPGTRPAPYLGSDASIPVFGHWSGLADAQRRQFPDLYRLVTLGIGLDGVVVPSEDDLRVSPPETIVPPRPTLVPVAAA